MSCTIFVNHGPRTKQFMLTNSVLVLVVSGRHYKTGGSRRIVTFTIFVNQIYGLQYTVYDVMYIVTKLGNILSQADPTAVPGNMKYVKILIKYM